MKTLCLVIFVSLISFTSLTAQPGLKIRSGGAVTVNGNLQVTTPAFSCGDIMMDIRDARTYHTVLIGSQCWMRENMNIGMQISGSLEQTDNSTIEKYCDDNLESNCDVYGGLYQWGEMVQYINGASDTTSWDPVPAGTITGICPAGWHIPTYDEWYTLATFLGGWDPASLKMKEAGTTHWDPPNAGATNESGFTALPGGGRFNYGFVSFQDPGFIGNWWVDHKGNTTAVAGYRVRLYSSSIGFTDSQDPKVDGYSVRCLKD